MSGLRNRLRTLREQSGTTVSATNLRPVVADATAFEPGIRARLERMRSVRRTAVAERGMDDEALATSLDGECLEPGVIRVASRVCNRHRHGHAVTQGCPLAGGLAPFLLDRPRERGDLVFIDTETSGLAGGTGTVVFLLGLGRFEGDSLVLVQYLLTRFAGEAAMLAHARQWLGVPAALVSFNGKSFDLPLLAARHRLCDLSDPFASLAHLDLLYPVRRLFAGRWPDCRLSTAEERLLGLRREGDLPGAEAPQAWFDWLRFRVPGRLAGVLEHNRLDLLSLAALIPYLEACHEDPVAWDADPLALVKAATDEPAERAAYRYLAANRYRLEDQASLELARLARRAGDWGLAAEIWRELAAVDNPQALEHLAKFHEHVERDLSRALALTRCLLELVPDDARHHHRSNRIQRKIDAGSPAD